MATTRIGKLGAPSPRDFTPDTNPEWFEGAHEQRLARALDVTQFGVNHLILEPGAYTALRHWHAHEDEFVLVLEGEVTLIDDNGAHRRAAGAYAAFPAGEANAHHLCNRSGRPARLLAVGTRHRGEEAITYPDLPGAPRILVARDAAGDRLPTARP